MPARDYGTPAVLARIRELVQKLGTHKEAADKTGIPYATLQRVMAGRSPLTLDRLGQIGAASGVAPGDILDDRISRLSDRRLGFNHAKPDIDIISVPALNIKAAAGDGSIADGERLTPGPFHFSADWLRRSFGSIASLRLVQVKGDSQEPVLHGGDWVLIDESRNGLENGLAVLLLDDCLMIKWLLREGHMLRLISRNTHYPETVLDLREHEDRIRVIGRSVFMFKAL